jgi:hypothetical protein
MNIKHLNRTFKVEMIEGELVASWGGYSAYGSTVEKAVSLCSAMIEEDMIEDDED